MMRSLLAAALIVCCTGSVLQSVLPPNGTTITIKAGDTSVIVLPLHDAAGDICKKFSNTVTNPLVISSASAVVHRNETDVNIYPYAVAAGSCAIHVSLIYGSTTIKYEYKFIVTGAVAADTAERAIVEGTVLLADEEAVNGDVVYPDVHWNDTDGNRIEAHAAGMLQSDVDHRWYWYGESKKTGDLADHGVNCYSADTIAGPWKNEGQVFHQQDIHMANVSGPFIVERPKVLYNAKTKLYVLWFHLDTGGYKFRHAGIATSTTPTGPFKFVHGLQPDGIPSLDMSLFRDPVDGQAYFVRSCNNAYTGISRLTEDYLDSKGMISNHSVFEGMALFRHENGTYYMMTSHLTGWNPNPLMLYRAAGKTLDDPQWVDMGNPTGSSTSFNTQPTYVVPYTPANGKTYFVYMGDDWVRCPPGGGLINACYTWLPINFHTDSITMEWRPEWDLNDPFAPSPGPPSPAPGPAPPGPTPAPPGPAPSTCTPATKLVAGSFLGLQDCGTSADEWGKPMLDTVASAAQEWVVDTTGKAAPIMLSSASDICIGVGSQNKLETMVCAKAPTWKYDSAGHHFVHSSDNKCLDITFCGQTPCAGELAEIYTCNGAHKNQEFNYETKTIVATGIGGKCLGVCA